MEAHRRCRIFRTVCHVVAGFVQKNFMSVLNFPLCDAESQIWWSMQVVLRELEVVHGKWGSRVLLANGAQQQKTRPEGVGLRSEQAYT